MATKSYQSLSEALTELLSSAEGFAAASINAAGAGNLPLHLPGGLYLRQLPMTPESAEGTGGASLDLCYLNGDHEWGEVQENLKLWEAKVKPTGVICGNGYDQKRVKGAVDLHFGLARRDVYAFGSEWMVDLSGPLLSPEKLHRLPLNLPFRVHSEDNGRISRAGSGEQIRVYMAGGLGDTMMATAAMGSFAERYNAPKCFDIYGAKNLEVFRHLPFVNTLNYMPHSCTTLIELLITVGASDDSITPNGRYCYMELDIDDTPLDQRYMRYIVTGREQHEAEAILYEHGWRGEKLLTLQANGGWKNKYWKGLVGLARMARGEGWFVCWTGSAGRVQVEGYDTPDGQGSLIGALTVRQLAALQSVSSAWVGQESGGTYLSIAVDCPSVMVCGPYDGEWMLQCFGGQKGPWRVIREDWLKKCGAERGLTCRGGNDAPCMGGIGAYCPHRMKQGSTDWNLIGVGADCIDAISPERVWASVKEIAREPKDYSITAPLPESQEMSIADMSPFRRNAKNRPVTIFPSDSYRERFSL